MYLIKRRAKMLEFRKTKQMRKHNKRVRILTAIVISIITISFLVLAEWLVLKGLNDSMVKYDRTYITEVQND